MRAIRDRWINLLKSWAKGYFRKHSLPRWLVFMLDSSAVVVTFILSYFLRYNFEQAPIDLSLALFQSLIVLGAYCSFAIVFRSFSGLLRHTTIKDIFTVIVTSTSALTVLVFATYISGSLDVLRIFNIPLSILVIHYVTLNVALFAFRIAIKMFYELLVTTSSVRKKNVIIFGAGSLGMTVRGVIAGDRSSDLNIVGFLDNNRKLQRKSLEGYRVYCPTKLNREFLEKHDVKTLVFAIKEISATKRSSIMKFAVDLGLEVLEVPSANSWLNGQFNVNQLKKIKVEDLLKRDTIQMNMKVIARGLEGKTILVTGAAGSIGSEIVRQLTRFDVGKLVLIDNAETPMFHLINELREKFSDAPVVTCLADVTDQIKMDWIFRRYKPDVVYHAAAYKHVPLMEDNPHEAIRVNVGSTLILSRLSQIYGVKKFVLVSTDKAVNPTNVMGASKRMGEMILQSRTMKPGNRVHFVITRFGNVLGSNGSVIPIFRKQIEEGGPVKVTHPEINRFFMTIPEACQLVLEAGFMGMGGEIFVFDMGEPVKISDLAKQMIRLSGLEPGRDIQIEYTGLRPGEKLYEELLYNKEKTLPTYNPKVKVGEVEWFDHKKTISDIQTLHHMFPSLEDGEVFEKVKNIVPEFMPTNEKYTALAVKQLDASEVIKQLETYPD
ncbi:MAG: nucleoside-diphosphate sugar epimerase/dehydratase [Bacteroidota bacterium]